MNKLLRVAETFPGATPFSPSNASSLLSADPSAPLSQCRAPGGLEGGRRQRWAVLPGQLAQAVLRQRALLPGIGCAQLLRLPATHSLGTTAWQLKPAQRDAFSSPRETLFLWEQEEEALRSGSDCGSKASTRPSLTTRTFHKSLPLAGQVTLVSCFSTLG